MSRYLVGIDLGTTNIAVAYIDSRESAAGRPRLHTFRIPQLTAPGQMGEADLLPSFLYLPGPHDPPGTAALPWNADAQEAIGLIARNHGAKVPGRQVSSAKSWLCHAGVDRTAPLLPWGAPPDVPRISPLEASVRFLRHIVEAWNHVKAKHEADRLEEQQVVVTVPASFDDTARNLTMEAAKKAGLKNVSLLEEPQAAFYAWLGTHTPDEAAQLKPGMRCLVVDVGGGTSDFSLIRVVEGEGELAFERDAVGDHLLLGGDNMDLALARAAESRLPTGRVDAAQFGSLIQACRAAKEALLADNPPQAVPVTVVGRGRAVVGGSISVSLTADDVTQAILDGFFPKAARNAVPERAAGAGLREMGLPYVSDPAVTRHLAAFLNEHLGTDGSIDAILFNGGVFQPAALRSRLLHVMQPWFTHDWKPLLLTSPSLDLAVAWGAAYFAWMKHAGLRRIGGGVPRAYYIGLDAADGGQPSGTVPVLCVVPRKLQEGTEIRLDEPVLQLSLGQPVLFPLYSSTVRDDAAGAVLAINTRQLLSLPPLHTVLRGGKRSGVKQVPVTLAAKCTEIGTLELACMSREGNRWRLEFNVRSIRGGDEAEGEPAAAEPMDVWPEERLELATAAIRACFGDGEPPQELPRKLEAALEASRPEWPTSVCRRLWQPLEAGADTRSSTPAHLSRWYNLAGFCLRPGFGDPLDRYRVESLWKIVTASASAGKGSLPEGGADFWIMCRRVAGGLNAALQQQLFTRLRPVLLPGKGKPPPKPGANELAEMWRAAASLERLDVRTRESLGESLISQLPRVPNYLFWSLARIGTRVPLYGPLNTIVHPGIAERWIEALLEHAGSVDADRLGWAFCLAQLARRSGVRALEISESLRERVLEELSKHTMPDAWPNMVRVISTDDRDASQRMFGESLPIGLRLLN